MIRKKSNKYRSKTRITANEYIRAQEVRAISEHGEMIGVLPLREAIEKAREAEKDVVLVNSTTDPVIVKIIEISKYKYQLQQKAAEGRKKAKSQDIKEVRFTPFMSDGDFESRLNKVTTFLKKGDKVRLSLQFRGREITKKEFGFDIFNRVIEATQEIGQVEMEPKLMGKKLIAQLQPVKKGS